MYINNSENVSSGNVVKNYSETVAFQKLRVSRVILEKKVFPGDFEGAKAIKN